MGSAIIYCKLEFPNHFIVHSACPFDCPKSCIVMLSHQLNMKCINVRLLRRNKFLTVGTRCRKREQVMWLITMQISRVVPTFTRTTLNTSKKQYVKIVNAFFFSNVKMRIAIPLFLWRKKAFVGIDWGSYALFAHQLFSL